MKIVTLSPKGQITIPKEYREKIKIKQYAFDFNGKTITLIPIKIKLLTPKKKKKDELDNFEKLSEKSFDFWNNKQDDIYQEFFK